MSDKTTAEKIAVMQAFLDGNKIEVSACPNCWSDWTALSEPHWYWGENDYRIKEEVAKYKRYIYKAGDGRQYVHTYHKGLPSPEICSGFVRWIDNDWQTV